MKDISFIFLFIGVWIGFFFGEIDPLLTALMIIVVMDYFSGIIKAVINGKLSSEIGYKGILKKVCIFLIVGIANIIDTVFIGDGSSFRTGTILFYLANEGISILENFADIGVPLPSQLTNVLKQIKKVGNKENDTNKK